MTNNWRHNYPWNYFEQRDQPDPLFYESEVEAIASRCRTSHAQFFRNRQTFNGIQTNEWSLDITEWTERDRIFANGKAVILPFVVLSRSHLLFEGKVFGCLTNILWYLKSEKRVNDAVRATISVTPKGGIPMQTKFCLEPKSKNVSLTFRYITKGAMLGANVQNDVCEISDDAPANSDDNPVSDADRDSVPEHLLEAQPAADALAQLAMQQLPAPVESMSNSESIVEVAPLQQAAPLIDIGALFNNATAETQRAIKEEDEHYRLKRAALQQQLDALEHEHTIKRTRLRNEAIQTATKMREEIEQQWRLIASSFQ